MKDFFKPPTAIIRHFEFENYTVTFSTMILAKPLSEQEKRELIFAGIAEIDNLPDEEKDCGECSNFFLDCVDEMLAQTTWKEPRHPVFLYAHQEMCLPCLCAYMNRIRQKITAPSNLPCGLIDVPRTLFQGLKGLLQTRSRVTPLAGCRN